MRNKKSTAAFILIILTATAAYADVARSASATGATEAEATKIAKGRAETVWNNLHNHITGWGSTSCSKRSDVDTTNAYECVVDFTTAN
jgi:hypothetical protein